MEKKAPGIYILEPLTKARGVDSKIETRRTLEDSLGPYDEQGNRTPFTQKRTGNLIFCSGLMENNQLSYKMDMELDQGRKSFQA